ncbi:4Fe-4S dicluster domain-containing protein [Brevibacillus ginsengisoli]|uniref:4Fe-4S dicluster domain-containing protein n=1 Tax=Brevibacillus ginsengisoli TaxID=363854 RepID=UPI003CF5C3A8
MSKHWGMVIDQNRCIGCWTCAVSCKSINNQPLGIFWNRVLTTQQSESESAASPATEAIDVPHGVFPHLALAYQPTSCQHCKDAPCEKVCPVSATFRREDGVVLVDYERCIGCRYCMAACPYGARVFNWKKPEYTPEAPVGYGKDYRSDGRLVFTPQRPIGVTEKCTFCVERIDEGKKPMCVELCPAGARFFGDLNDPRSEVSQMGGHQLMSELGTHPSVRYIPVDKRPKV